jgi:hypothetical protein
MNGNLLALMFLWAIFSLAGGSAGEPDQLKTQVAF